MAGELTRGDAEELIGELLPAMVPEGPLVVDPAATIERAWGVDRVLRRGARPRVEEDNVYHPGYDPDEPVDPPPPANWSLDESGTLEARQDVRFETPELPAGRYVFEMTGTGDADLYVRLGEASDTNTYDCRPYIGSSNETRIADLPSPGVVHVMVRGDRGGSNFELTGQPE